jgi:ribonuclease BN (tRNA processing enzyme)
MRLTTIGTGTAAPHARRVSAAHLVETHDVRLLLDCGSGAVHRMAQLGIAWPTITHVALTHFHTDHIADLPQLITAWRWGQLPPRHDPVTLYGPPGTGALLERLAAVYGVSLLAPGFPLTVREIGADEVIRLPGGVEMRTHAVPHAPESVAYSISEGTRRLVYTGDTGESEALGEWAADCDLLLAECSLPDTMAIREHLTPRQAGALAARARTARLVLTHFYPPVEAVDIRGQVAEHYAGPCVCAHDGWFIDF